MELKSIKEDTHRLPSAHIVIQISERCSGAELSTIEMVAYATFLNTSQLILVKSHTIWRVIALKSAGFTRKSATTPPARTSKK